MQTLVPRLSYGFHLWVIFTLIFSLWLPILPALAAPNRTIPAALPSRVETLVNNTPASQVPELPPFSQPFASNQNQPFSKPELTASPMQFPSEISQNGASAAPVAQASASSSLLFIENVGQFDTKARFMVRGLNGTLYLTEDALWLTLIEQSSPVQLEREFHRRALLHNEPKRGVNLKLSFPGSNPHPRLEPFSRLDTQVSYFIGNDPTQWRTNVPVWRGVRYVDLYPGVDLEITGGPEGQLSQRLVIRHKSGQAVGSTQGSITGTSSLPSQSSLFGTEVRLRMEGTAQLTLDGESLHLSTAVGNFSLPLLKVVTPDNKPMTLPVASPKIEQNEVIAPFAPAASASLSFSTPHLASPLPLALIPSLQTTPPGMIYTTFLGGSNSDGGISIDLDEEGNVYVVGTTSSTDFPPAGPPDDTFAGSQEAYVAKLSPDGTSLLYVTFLGGDSWDTAVAITVDQDDNAYLIGVTASSTNFPLFNSAYGTYGGGLSDVFITKLNAAGNTLLYSTYLGGNDFDAAGDITVDQVGNIYVTGGTDSSNFPTFNALDSSQANSTWTDIFITKLEPDGSVPSFSTFLGGPLSDMGWDITLDSAGDVYVIGDTQSSTGLLLTANALQPALSGSWDAFIVKLDGSNNTLLYSTYFGGSDSEFNIDGTVDNAGNVYVTGYTSSSDLPSANSLQAYGGSGDVFVVKLKADGSSPDYSTYLGGSNQEEGAEIAVDNTGKAYITGYTQSTDFPIDNPLQTLNAGYRDVFVTALAADGSSRTFSTYLGGSDSDEGLDIAIDNTGHLYLSGATWSSDFETTAGVYDPTHNGSGDAFITKLALSAELVTLDVLDRDDNPVDTLTLNAEGWATPNPIMVEMTLNCPSDTVGSCSSVLDLDLSSTDQAARFYIYEADLNASATCNVSPADIDQLYSLQAYNISCDPVTVLSGNSVTYRWSVWIQPSAIATLDITAEWSNASASKSVTIPQAQIHPVVFVHGILGSMPPRNGVVTQWPQGPGNVLDESYLDPWIGSYKPLINNFLKMGYEINSSLFPVTYDWRQSNRRSAYHLGGVLKGRVQENAPIYVDSDPKVQADVIVHSMGGMVLRSYLEDLALSNDGQWNMIYQDEVNKAITIATPHRGFPATYNTYEGLTWENYFSDEVASVSDPSREVTGKGGVTLNILTDNLVWPYFILKRYKPTILEACGALIPFNPSYLINGLPCDYQALYHYSHDSDQDRGVHSLPEMLPPESSVSFLTGDNNGTTYNPLLDGADGLNSEGRVERLRRLGADPEAYDNLFAIYNTAQPTPITYDVERTEPWPAACPNDFNEYIPYPISGLCLPLPQTPPDPSVTPIWAIPPIYPWPHGEPVGGTTPNEGDGLIPAYSTQWSTVIQAVGGGFVDPDNQELEIGPPFGLNPASGHVFIMAEPKTQRTVGVILTGIGGSPEEAAGDNTGVTFPLVTEYHPPRIGWDNYSTILAYLVFSPVDVMITDPSGRRIGYNPTTNQVVNEIPGAFYSGPGADEEFILIPEGLEGQYLVTTRGTASGDFAISSHLADSVGVTNIGVVTGTTTIGQIITQSLSYSPNLQLIFADDMESGSGNWTVAAPGGAGTWALTTTVTGPPNTYSPPTAWTVGETGVITPGVPLTLTLNPTLDLSQARRARLTFWYSATLSSEAEGLVEGSTDGGQNWFILAHQPTTPTLLVNTGTLTEPVYEAPAWSRRVVDLSALTGPDQNLLQLRFRLIPGTTTERWWLDEVRVEAVEVPDLFGFSFEDDVEGLRYWDVTGDWIRTDAQVHSRNWAWQSGQAGDTLTLAGRIPVPQAVTPTLSFWQIVSPTTQGIVEFSTNAGVSWTPVYTTGAPEPQWRKVEVVLSEAAGLTTTLRFRQEAGPTGGWLIDDIHLEPTRNLLLYTLPFTDDMEGPGQNWLAVGGWQPVTGTAHSLQTSWYSQAEASRLQLGGTLELSGATSPALTFWQQFNLPGGSVGQVQLSSDAGLSWQPVLTVTGLITTWTPLTVGLESYAGQQVQLAFELITVTTPVTNQGWYVDDLQVSETAVISAFQESGGQVVMEAEHFSHQTPRQGPSWLLQTAMTGYTGTGYLEAAPDIDLNFSESFTTTSSELQFTFQTSLTGTYYLWLRGHAPNGAGDSLYLGLDGTPGGGGQRLTGFAPQSWSWANSTMEGQRARFEIEEAGLHTLHLWVREDGLRLDRLLLTLEEAYLPAGTGPAESESYPPGTGP